MTDERANEPGSAGMDEPSLGLDPPTPAAAAPSTEGGAYRVLARKYRPSTFEDLIGQEPMVRTLANAFKLGRVHQAYLLTGVRGVGKTTTARILARAFNYELPARDGRPAVDAPTVDMPELGVHCQAIIDSRHIDVIEMDAASHTSVDDVREIIENARFRPVMARAKVYIIDEVHMLSKSAFNALLKTLEEPPPHVKFLFATTEIEKVPITVRSRCLRFDLRRIEPDVLIAHLRGICDKEGVRVEPDALALIARASEGSVRDALSLLDQAIAHGASIGHDTISAESLRDMLGVADRARVIDMFEAVMKGDVATALAILKEQYDLGADPYQALVGLAEFVHFVTRFKLVPDTPMDASMSAQEFTRGSAFAKALSIGVLTRAWQILTKGLQDMKDAPRPIAAADMVLVRLAYAADLPGPEDVLKRLNGIADGGATSARASASSTSSGASARGGGGMASAAASAQRQPSARADAAPMASAEPRVRVKSLEDVVTLAATHRDVQLKIALEQDVRLVRFEEGSIDFSLAPGASPQVAQTLMRRLQEWTGIRWMVALSREEGAPTIKERADAREADKLTGARALPLVRSVLERFPGAEIVAIRSAADEAPPTSAAIAPEPAGGDDDIGYADDIYSEDDL